MSGGITVSGGGSIEVDTAPMLAAAAVLAGTADELAGILRDLDGCAPGLPPAVAAAAWAARTAGAAAHGSCGLAASALRLAGLRYGLAEQAAARLVAVAAAAEGAAAGSALRAALPLGPAPVLLGIAATGTAAGIGLLTAAAGQAVRTGGVAPQLDPTVLLGVRSVVGSADDAVRALAGIEGPADVLVDDPARPLGTQAIAGAAADALPGADGQVAVHRAFRPLPVPAPASLGELADRVPPSGSAEPQIRVERYADHAIVYVTGTVTFAPSAGDEPFDMRSNLQGIADRPSASGSAVVAAMRAAGVGREEPVLLVGHSQGALDAVRIAQHGGQRVAGVVTLGGPTGQIALPPDVPVLAVEHEEDPVPTLGGAVATGTAGAARLVLRRRLYDHGTPPPAAGVPSHALETYAETLHLADRSPEPRVAAFRRRIAPFLGGTGTVALYRAERTAPVPATPSRSRRAAAAPAR